MVESALEDVMCGKEGVLVEHVNRLPFLPLDIFLETEDQCDGRPDICG